MRIPRDFLCGPLRNAVTARLRTIELLGDGAMIHWPKLDEGLDLAHVMEHVLGVRLASTVARKAGAVRSAAIVCVASRVYGFASRRLQCRSSQQIERSAHYLIR